MLDLALKMHAEIVDFWKFFVPSAVALLGWVFSRKEPWPWTQRVSIAIAYVGFSVFNLIALIKSYQALGVVVSELKALGKSANITDAAFVAMVQRTDMGPWQLGIAFHIVVDLIVLYFIVIGSGRKTAT